MTIHGEHRLCNFILDHGEPAQRAESSKGCERSVLDSRLLGQESNLQLNGSTSAYGIGTGGCRSSDGGIDRLNEVSLHMVSTSSGNITLDLLTLAN